MRTMRFILFGSGPSRCMSSGANPASRKRLCMASAAAVTLPFGVSVVLISISCLKMSRASARSAAETGGNELCPKRGRLKKTRNPAKAERMGKNVECMCGIVLSLSDGLQKAPNRFIVMPPTYLRCLMHSKSLLAAAAITLGAAALTLHAQERPKITGISHLAVYTSDPAATDHYYRVILGAAKEADPENPAGVKYAFSATQFIEVLPLPANTGVNRMDHAGFNT